MAVTLTEAAKYTTNMVKRGVLEEIYKDSMIMQDLPFIDIVGNAYQYLRENTLGTGSFFDPNEVWTEDTGDVTQVTAVIKILGGDADVDNFLKATRSDKTDFEAETIQNKAKGIKHTFLDTFYYGSTVTNTKAFDGIHRLITATATTQRLHQGSAATGAALSALNLDVLVDAIRDGKPDALVMTKNIRRRVNAFIRASGGVLVSEKNKFGVRFSEWDGIPVYADDFLTQTETISGSEFSAKTGGATSSVFALRFGTKDLLGLQNGGLETKKIGQLHNKDGQRHRIKWYPSIALMRTIGTARLDGITDVAAVA